MIIFLTTLIVVLLYIHRPFLALALLHHPHNPLESPYSQSVLAAQSAASVIVRSLARQLEKHPATYMRFWSIWIYAFSAAVNIFIILKSLLFNLGTLGCCRIHCHKGPCYAVQRIE